MRRIRQRLPEEVFDEVFQFVFRMAVDKKLLSGETVGVDSTTLEANAAVDRRALKRFSRALDEGVVLAGIMHRGHLFCCARLVRRPQCKSVRCCPIRDRSTATA